MYTIRDLCKVSKLSRSTILYYDSLGLLKPAERSESNYRLYSDESLEILRKICLYRDAGVSLKDIGWLIAVPENDEKNIRILESTLFQLNNLERAVQKKQSTVIDMMKAIRDKSSAEISDEQIDLNWEHVDKWISSFAFDIYKALGFDNDEMEE